MKITLTLDRIDPKDRERVVDYFDGLCRLLEGIAGVGAWHVTIEP